MIDAHTHVSFPDTHWTLIESLSDPAEQQHALEQLCQTYWGPVYAFLKRNHAPDKAEDITQEFLLMVLERRLFERAERGEGRLRSWLLKSLDYFMANQHRLANTQKRGGRSIMLSLDNPEVMAEIHSIAASSLTPSEAFDRTWVSFLVRRAVKMIEQQYRNSERGELFDRLLPWLLQEDEAMRQDQAAEQCGMSLANFRVQLHRLRGRYRDELRRQIALTVDSDQEIKDELEHLFSISGRPL
jgi:RNA polymerase sigma-70 factor (ECF subfamily)